MAIEEFKKFKCDMCGKEEIKQGCWLPKEWLHFLLDKKRNGLKNIEKQFCSDKCTLKYFHTVKRLEFAESDNNYC